MHAVAQGIWLPATRQAGQVVTKSHLWGTGVVEVWLPAQGTTIRVTADQVESLERSRASVGQCVFGVADMTGDAKAEIMLIHPDTMEIR